MTRFGEPLAVEADGWAVEGVMEPATDAHRSA
jgi:hypothetical protein